MAKLSAFPKCYMKDIVEGRMSLEEWIEMGSALPVDGMELYLHFLRSYDSAYLADIRRRIAGKGLEIPMMCYSPDFTIPDKDQRQQEIVKQQEAIKVSAELGVGFCRTLSGQRQPDLQVEEGVKIVADAIQACLATAEENDVVLVMENHYKDDFWEFPEFAQKSEVYLAIINQIDSPYFGVQYDPSNAIVAGEDPIDVLHKVKHRVRTMHASDRHLLPGHTLAELTQADGTIGYSPYLCHGIIGHGLNDYDEIFRILYEVGYDGWISIEDGMNGMEELQESAEFLRRKMAQSGLAED